MDYMGFIGLVVNSEFSRVGSSSNMSVLDSGMTTGKKDERWKEKEKGEESDCCCEYCH